MDEKISGLLNLLGDSGLDLGALTGNSSDLGAASKGGLELTDLLGMLGSAAGAASSKKSSSSKSKKESGLLDALTQSGLDLNALSESGLDLNSLSESGLDLGALSDSGIDILDLIGTLTGTSTTTKKKKSTSSSSSKKSDTDDLLSKLLGQEAKEYPQFSQKTYWAIRDKFKRSIPEKVTASTLTGATGLQTDTVKSTVLPALELMELTKDGKPTSLLKAWINDDKYEEACEKILENVYPSSLRKLECETKTEQNSVISWFKKNADVSETTAKKMLTIFALLSAPELPESAEEKKSSSSKSSSSKSSSSKKSSTSSSDEKDSIKVTKKQNKATVTIKIVVDDDITKRELGERLEDLAAEIYAELK